MPSASVARFKENYEKLAGIVHIVAPGDELDETIASILREADAKRVAISGLPAGVRESVQRVCSAGSIEVLQPPYDNAKLPGSIDAAQVGISSADFAIADSGALVEFAVNDAHRLVSTLPRTHVAVVREEDVTPLLSEAAGRVRKFLEENPSNAAVTFISGPSRTGDVELKITLGVHGPEVAHAIILENPDA